MAKLYATKLSQLVFELLIYSGNNYETDCKEIDYL